MEDKRYLKIGNKLAYGSGDMATNFYYGVITSFMLIYLTDTMGLNSGIVGTLMALSRVLDGVTDVLFGTMIDRTKTRFGKARPWMLWTILPIAVCEVLLFSIPNMGTTAQYAYFFVIYTIANDFFFTANNVAYATLSALITPNKNECVQLGVFRFAFATVGSLLVAAITNRLVVGFGGGVAGWRMAAIVYAVLFIALQLWCFFCTKEISDEGEEKVEKGEKVSFLKNLQKSRNTRSTETGSMWRVPSLPATPWVPRSGRAWAPPGRAGFSPPCITTAHWRSSPLLPST